MFRIRKPSGGPFGDVRHAHRWLASLPTNDPLFVQRELQKELALLAGRTAIRTPGVLAAVFSVDTRTTGLVKTLMAQYADLPNRSSKVEDQLWRGLFDLQQSFQACYAAFAREISDHRHHNRWMALLPELIARQLIHLAHDARIRLYRCEPWIPAKWAELHAVFSRAYSLHFERKPLLIDPTVDPSTIEREYLAALCLQHADPCNMTPRQIEWTAAQLDEWCRPLRLTLEPQTAATFVVDLATNAGLKRRSVGPLEGRVLFVDVRPLHALLLQKRIELEQAVKNEPRSEKSMHQRGELELFVKLASRFDPEFRPLSRRGERIPASGAVDAIVGFTNISGYLSADRGLLSNELPAGRNFANTMDLAVFGRTRVEPDNRAESARRRLSAYAAPGGPWEMKDMSVSGFRLHAPMSVATDVTLSMLVGIHRRGEDTWVMGIVRRMRRLSADNAEIGLQLIANALTSAHLVEQRKARDADYAVDGDTAHLTGRRFRCLYLSFNRKVGEPAVQSLIVPPGEYRQSRRYTLELPEMARTIRYGRLLEQHSDWAWTVVELLEPDVPAAHRTSGG